MKMKQRGGILNSGSKLGLPLVLLFCSFSLLVGFYASFILSDQDFITFRPKERLVESIRDETDVPYDPLVYGETGDAYVASIPFQILSWKPRALYFPNFATAEQCKSIIKMAKKKLAPSSLALREGETAENTKGIRTSSGMFISSSEDKSGILDVIEKKIARATMIPQRHGEAFNVLRYEIGQRYNSHYDAFNPTEYSPQKSQRFLTISKLERKNPCFILQQGAGVAQQVASFLLYLTNVEEGGETMFPFENGLNLDEKYDYEKCIGLKIKPRQGDGLLFYSLYPNGTIDQTSLHGSCPVIKGQKWVATKWIRDQEDD